MASIFNALHIGYSGLSAAQVGINTTGHNIANAEVEGYSRQRVVTAAATPLSVNPGNVGNGTQVTDIKRVFDNFVFDRYSSISADKEYSEYQEKNLQQLSTYFPEIDGVGVKSELSLFYDSWQTFSDNPSNDSIKVALAKQTETLSKHIAQTQDEVKTLQNQINEDIVVNINEVNLLAKDLAKTNGAIDIAEAAGGYTANDLRDKRNLIEKDLANNPSFAIISEGIFSSKFLYSLVPCLYAIINTLRLLCGIPYSLALITLHSTAYPSEFKDAKIIAKSLPL